MRNRSTESVLVALLSSALATNTLLAAQPSSIATAPSSKDPAQIDQAIADIRAMFVGPTRFAAIENLKARWLRTLITLKRHNEAAELALAGVLAWPRLP
jgi:hypothetical protein